MISVSSRMLHLGTTAALALAVAGFLAGTRAPPPVERRPEAPSPPGETDPVPRYGDMGSAVRGDNARLYDGALETLRGRLAARADDEVTRAEMVSARAGRRAYDGAPPTIPHRVDQLAVPACIACHQQGMVVAGKVAPAFSHEPYASCTQCHVVQRDPRGLGPSSPMPPNTFVGVASPGAGRRAWEGAPPQIPHAVHMRERCESCHGKAGPNPIRSSHPERQSCQQCHVGQAALEQRGAAIITEGYAP